MASEQIQRARALIQAGQYDQARALLQGLHDPEAARLLAGLQAAAPSGTQRLMHSRAWYWIGLAVAGAILLVAAGVLVYVLSQPAPERFDVRLGGAPVTTEKSYSGAIDLVVRGTGQTQDGQAGDAYYVFADAAGVPLEPTLYDGLLINGEPASAFWVKHRAYDEDHAYRITINAPGGPLTFSAPGVWERDDGDAFAVEVHKTE